MTSVTVSSDGAGDSPSRDHWEEYRHLNRCALDGAVSLAEQGFNSLLGQVTDNSLRARIWNDLGVLATASGSFPAAHQAFLEARGSDPEWDVPLKNLERLATICQLQNGGLSPVTHSLPRPRIAIVSLLFNWPSTGGGIVHTAELAKFLYRAGYDVKHFVIKYDPWSIGQIADAIDWPIEQLVFAESEWSCEEIQRGVRQAVTEFAPDSVIITDSWNFKPRLAEALQGHRYFLRLAAQECVCPLNNVRLLWDSAGSPQACPQHQLATHDICRQCVAQRDRWSGSLHQAERALAGFERADYDSCLRQSFRNAAGVLVVNPLIAELVKPYTSAVHVVPSGFDATRFSSATPASPNQGSPIRLLFAGLVDESMKGFAVLHAACRTLWSERQDFRLVVTGDPTGMADEFTEFIGWQSQTNLPLAMQAADIVVCPTIAEEALGRTAVEAMGAARPVLASRIGGLQFAVLDEATGLLFEPADSSDLLRQLRRLLDSHDLRARMGQAGRERFLRHFTWDVILDRHYRKLLGLPVRDC